MSRGRGYSPNETPNVDSESKDQFDMVSCYKCGCDFVNRFGSRTVDPDEIRCPECDDVVGLTREKGEFPIYYVRYG